MQEKENENTKKNKNNKLTIEHSGCCRQDISVEDMSSIANWK